MSRFNPFNTKGKQECLENIIPDPTVPESAPGKKYPPRTDLGATANKIGPQSSLHADKDSDVTSKYPQRRVPPKQDAKEWAGTERRGAALAAVKRQYGKYGTN